MRLHGTTFGYLVAIAIAAGEGGIGVLMPPYLTALGYGPPVVGLFVGLYAAASLLARWPGGRWYRQGLVRPLIAASLLTVAAANLLYPLVTDAVVLGALRAIGSAGFGLGTTLNLAMFIDAAPSQRSRDRAMSFYTAALAGGFMTGNLTAGFFSDRGGFPAGFLAVAVLPLLVAPLTLVAVEPSSMRGARPGGEGWRGALRAMSEPLLFVVLVEAFLLHFLFGLHYAYSALYFLAVGATLGNLGFIRGLFSGTQVLSRLGSSWPFRRFGYRRVAVAMMIGQVISLMLVPATTDLRLLTLLSMAYGATRGVGMVANALGLAEASDESAVSRGTASGLFNASSDIGILIGGIVSGAVVELLGLGSMFVVTPFAILLVHWASLWYAARQRARWQPTGEAPRA